jgi:hypothetical protein
MGLGSVATAAARCPPPDIGVDRTNVGTKPSTPPPPAAAAIAAVAIGRRCDLDNGALASAHEEDKADDISSGNYSHIRKRTAAAQQQQQQQRRPWLKTAKHQLNQ